MSRIVPRDVYDVFSDGLFHTTDQVVNELRQRLNCQGYTISRSDVRTQMTYLLDNQCIRQTEEGTYQITQLGIDSAFLFENWREGDNDNDLVAA